MTAIAAIGLGGVFGALIASGGICFNRGLREASQRRWTVLRVFAFAVALQLLLLPVLIALGVEVSPIGLFPVAQVVGGLTFGVGMALAGGCIAGILWKTGAGSIATAIAITGFAAGELLIRGPGAGLADSLDATHLAGAPTLDGLLGLGYAPLAIALGLLLLVLLLRGGRAGIAFGLALGAVASFAWVIAGWVGYGYGLGFVGSADGLARSVSGGGALPFQVLLAVGVILGSALAIRGPLRLPNSARAGRALAGGLLMGIGGTVAHGCNIGNGLTGVPLLSIGSLLATAMMAVGTIATWKLALSKSSRLRGNERPEPTW